jgi:hypothetical protein
MANQLLDGGGKPISEARVGIVFRKESDILQEFVHP